MLSKDTETYAVVITVEPGFKDYYHVELADAEGKIFTIKAHAETVLDYRLVVNKEIDEKTFHDLNKAIHYQQAYQYAVNILSRRRYTEKEMVAKLRHREETEVAIKTVVAKLKALELIDDLYYAQAFIQNQLDIGKKSKREILSKLYQKGIDEDILADCEEMFDAADEIALIAKEIVTTYKRYMKKCESPFELKQKVVSYLGRKGFDFYEVGRQYDYFVEDLEAGLVEI